ncbi:4Fe-4S binding domain protein [Desulfovibrio sp. A2]|nr:4Fe-4S binding domain protein [Desulfovibrio sp. A2]
MKKQLGFLVDTEKCIGCFTCAMACKNVYHQQKGIAWRQVHPMGESIYPHRERAWLSLACNHCENPVCLEQCPVKAYAKREDGIVVHDQDACIGCGNCVRSCPYGAPKMNPVEKRAEKCSMCWQRIDAGLDPACVHSCPVGALSIADISTARLDGWVQYPAGYPEPKRLNPSTRFKAPRQPREIRRNDA